FVDVIRCLRLLALFEHRSNARYHFPGALAFADDTLERVTRFVKIGGRVRQPLQTSIAVHLNRRYWLANLMSDRCSHLAHLQQAGDACEFLAQRSQSVL